jgi:hypothetical protein
LEKIEAAWKLHELLVHTATVDAPVPAGGAVALPSMLPLLLEWLQPTLARSERYVMSSGGSGATPTAASKKQAKKKQKQHHGEDEDDDAAKIEEKAVRDHLLRSSIDTTRARTHTRAHAHT